MQITFLLNNTTSRLQHLYTTTHRICIEIQICLHTRIDYAYIFFSESLFPNWVGVHFYYDTVEFQFLRGIFAFRSPSVTEILYVDFCRSFYYGYNYP